MAPRLFELTPTTGPEAGQTDELTRVQILAWLWQRGALGADLSRADRLAVGEFYEIAYPYGGNARIERIA